MANSIGSTTSLSARPAATNGDTHTGNCNLLYYTFDVIARCCRCHCNCNCWCCCCCSAAVSESLKRDKSTWAITQYLRVIVVPCHPLTALHDLAKSATATATARAPATAHNQQSKAKAKAWAKTRAIGAVGRSRGLVEICGKTWKTCKTKVDKINSTHTHSLSPATLQKAKTTPAVAAANNCVAEVGSYSCSCVSALWATIKVKCLRFEAADVTRWLYSNAYVHMFWFLFCFSKINTF